jgi:hypothetical protein
MEPRFQILIDKLNDPDKSVRLSSLRLLMEQVRAKKLSAPESGDDVNNHIHTTYSFSPYSPTRAIWEAYRAGLRSAGIMDHDSICGAREFIDAGVLAGIATTIGLECRADFSRTPLNGRRINNPDQLSNAYIALHGIPHTAIAAVKTFFEPCIHARQERNVLMTDRINALLRSSGIVLDYKRDVVPLSHYHDGGTVTERHLLLALVRRCIASFGKGEPFVDFLKNTLGLTVPAKVRAHLLDKGNAYYEYEALGFLKSVFVNAFYIDATGECPNVSDIIAFSKKIGCICAYAYLGDITESVTGDKRAQHFEDGYLDELTQLLKELGFEAITYMPSRNSRAQLTRIISLCNKHGFLQISGEDINSPQQLFVCGAMRKTEFRHLVDATWALIGHERAATIDRARGFFSPQTVARIPDLNARIRFFKTIGLQGLALPTADSIVAPAYAPKAILT